MLNQTTHNIILCRARNYTYEETKFHLGTTNRKIAEATKPKALMDAYIALENYRQAGITRYENMLFERNIVIGLLTGCTVLALVALYLYQ